MSLKSKIDESRKLVSAIEKDFKTNRLKLMGFFNFNSQKFHWLSSDYKEGLKQDLNLSSKEFNAIIFLFNEYYRIYTELDYKNAKQLDFDILKLSNLSRNIQEKLEEFLKNFSEMILNFMNNSPDKKLEQAFNTFHKRYTTYDHMLEKVHNLTNLLNEEVRMKEAKDNSKRIINFNIGKNKIHLEVLLDFPLKNYMDRVNYNLIEKKLKAKDAFSYNGYNQISEHLKRTSLDNIQIQITKLMTSSIKEILEKNSFLISSSNAKIFIKIKEDRSSGEYVTVKSNSSNIFININSIDSIISYIINNPHSNLDPTSDTYKTIVHELIHSYDRQLNKDITGKNEIEKMNPNISLPERVAIKNYLIQVRSEGIAILSHKLISDMNHSNYSNYMTDERVLEYFNTTKLVEYYSNVQRYKNVNFFVNATSNYNSGGNHIFGEYITWIIFFDECKQFIEDIELTHMHSVSFRWKHMPKEVIKNFIKKITMLSLEQFFRKYIQAYKNLGQIDSEEMKFIKILQKNLDRAYNK